jgi:hypothetical protein
MELFISGHASAIQLASEISNPGSGTYAYTA